MRGKSHQEADDASGGGDSSQENEIDDADPVSYTHPPSPRDQRGSRMPSSA